MFKRIVLVILCAASLLSTYMAQAKSGNVQIVRLSATSSKDPRFDLTSLLNSDSKEGWEPGISGTGAEEGVFVEFKDAVLIDGIELQGTDTFNVSVNGTEIKGIGNKFTTNTEVKTLFIHVKADPSKPSVLSSFSMSLTGKRIEIQKPMTINGEVRAKNVLSPVFAYCPYHLFDSKTEMAFALDGKKIDATKPIPLFDLTFKKSVGVKGLYVWNGYQRSENHYYANSRLRKITVSDGTHTAQFELLDTMDSHWLAFPGGGWDVSTLSFTADQVYSGTSYKDLVISEISFVNKMDEPILVNVEKPVYEKNMYTFLDKSLKSLSVNGQSEFFLKFRTDGSFTAICEKGDEKSDTYRNIWEGNWERKDSHLLRVFGRHYISYPDRTGGVYGTEVLKNESSIFQSAFKVENLNKIKAKEKHRIYEFEKATNVSGSFPKDEAAFWDTLKGQPEAYFFESDLFSAIVVPDDFKK